MGKQHSGAKALKTMRYGPKKSEAFVLRPYEIKTGGKDVNRRAHLGPPQETVNWTPSNARNNKQKSKRRRRKG